MDRTCVYTPGAADARVSDEWCMRYARNVARVPAHWDLAHAFWAVYREHRRLGDCPCQAAQASLDDLNL